MTTIIRPPSKISKEIIRSFYYLEFDQTKESNSGIVVDDACYELLFVKEKNVNFINSDKEAFRIPPSFTLINPKSPFKFEFPETFSVFSIKIQPWMNASYVPTQKGKVINLDTIYPKINELHQALMDAESIQKKIDRAENFLLGLPIKQTEETNLIKNICLLIYERFGNITVNEIADEYKIYRQKLNQLFKQEVKYTLKVLLIV